MSDFIQRSKIMFETRKQLEKSIPKNSKIRLRYSFNGKNNYESKIEVILPHQYIVAKKTSSDFKTAFVKARNAIAKQIAQYNHAEKYVDKKVIFH